MEYATSDMSTCQMRLVSMDSAVCPLPSPWELR